MAEYAVDYSIVFQRMKLSGLVLGGVLGFLVLVWLILGNSEAFGDLRAASNGYSEEGKGRRFPSVLLGILLVAAVLLASLWFIAASGPIMPHATAPFPPNPARPPLHPPASEAKQWACRVPFVLERNNPVSDESKLDPKHSSTRQTLRKLGPPDRGRGPALHHRWRGQFLCVH